MIPGARELFVLDPSVAHLNHGSFGAIPTVVREERARLLDEFDANPLKLVTGNLMERTEQARDTIVAFLGAEPELCAFVGNATLGVAIALNSVAPRAGDEVVITDHSYNAVTLAAQEFSARHGARVVVAPVELGAGAAETVDAITAKLTDRTRLVIVDQVSSATAQLHPVAAIAVALRERGVPLLVDGAHAPGMVDKPMAGADADFWVGNMHKWAYAPVGTAILRVAERWRDRVVPPAVSHFQPRGFPHHVEQYGTRDFTTWLAAPKGLTLFEAFGADRIRAHNAALAAYGQRVIGEALGVASHVLPDPGPGVAMRLVPLPEGIGDDLDKATLLRRRIADELGVETAVNPWRNRGWLRVSAQIYNTEGEFDRLAETLPGLLRATA